MRASGASERGESMSPIGDVTRRRFVCILPKGKIKVRLGQALGGGAHPHRI